MGARGSTLGTSAGNEQTVAKPRRLTVTLYGSSETGKTVLLSTFKERRPPNSLDSYQPTVGIAYSHLEVPHPLGGDALDLTIWDMSGNQKYRKMEQFYLKTSHLAILVFDVTREETWDRVAQNAILFKTQAPEKPVILVANKVDLSSRRTVQHRDVAAFASKLDILHIETSATDYDSVYRLFETLANYVTTSSTSSSALRPPEDYVEQQDLPGSYTVRQDVPETPDGDEPPLTLMERMLEECPRIRLLVIGKSGVGKSTAINRIFEVDVEPSHYTPGQSKIEQEYAATKNGRFVVHDSKGIQAGDNAEVKVIKDFLASREMETKLSDRIHVVWYFSAVDSRSLQTGDTDLIQGLKESNVPLVFVFSKWDMAIASKLSDLLIEQGKEEDSMLLSERNKLRGRARAQAISDFEANVWPQFENAYRTGDGRSPRMARIARNDQDSLINLINVTQSLFADNATLRAVFASAQRADVNLKLKLAVKAAMSHMIAASVGGAQPLPGLGQIITYAQVGFVHKEMTSAFNLADPHKELVYDAVRQTFANVASWTSLLSLVVSRGLLGWASGFVIDSPKAARLVMLLTADYALIFERLFWIVHARPNKIVERGDIDSAIAAYVNSGCRAGVEKEVNAYMTNFAVKRCWNTGLAEQEVLRIVEMYRVVATRAV